MRKWMIGLFACMAMSLACSGGGFTSLDAGGLGRSSVGAYASSYAEHASKSENVPCAAFGLGQEVKVADFTFVFEEVWTSDAETTLPLIRNHEERSAFEGTGGKALVVKYKVRNDSPVKKRRDVPFLVFNTEGERLFRGPYNGKILGKEHGLTDELEAGGFPPGKWVDMGDVYAVTPDKAADAVAYLAHRVNELDARGRKVRVLKDHAVVDLGKPGEHRPHINPEKR